QGAYAIGAVTARDRGTGRNFANVLRVQRDFGGSAAAGVFGSTRSLADGGRNSVTGVDGRLRRGAWSGSAQIAGSFTSAGNPGPAGTVLANHDGFAALASLTRTGRAFNWVAGYNERSRSFESALGYIDRVDFRRTDHLATYRWFRQNSSLIDFGPDLSGF